MPFIALLPYRLYDSAPFDPIAGIKKLREHFPEVELIPGDQLALQYERAKQVLPADNPKAQQVLRRMRLNAELYGPAYAFRIPFGERCVLRRDYAKFGSDSDIPEDMQRRIIRFMKEYVSPGDEAVVRMNPGVEIDLDEL